MSFEEKKGLIITLSLLKAENKKIAFVKGNRPINEKIVVSRMESLANFRQLVPAVIVNAADVKAAGLEVIDAETGKSISDDELESYVVLLDGQHRYMAYLKNQEAGKTEQGEFYMIFPLNENIPPQKMLSVINNDTNLWGAGDYGKALLVMSCKEKLPLVEFLNELMDLGIQISTAQRFGCLKYMDITKAMLAEAIKGEVHKALKFDRNLETGKRFWEVASKVFDIKIIKHRYFIDFFIEKYDNADDEERIGLWERFGEFISTMDSKDVESINKTTGSKNSTKEQRVLRLLNVFYDAKFGKK